IVCLNVDPWRDICSQMPCSNVEAPFGVGQTRKPYCVDEVCGQRCGRDKLDSFRFLVNFKSGRDHHKVLDRDGESESAERSGFPIHGVTTIAVFLCIGPANSGIRHETELFSEHDEFCTNEVDITVRRILVLDSLHNVGIVGAQHHSQRDGGQMFVCYVVRGQEFRFEVEDIHSCEVEKWTHCGVCPICVLSASKSKLQPIPESFFDSHVDVVSSDRASVHGVEADRRPSKFVFGCRNDFRQGLEENS